MVDLKNIKDLFSAILWRWWYYFHPDYTFTLIAPKQLPQYFTEEEGILPLRNTPYDKKKWERLDTSLKRWGMLRPVIVQPLDTPNITGEEEYSIKDGRHRLYLWVKSNPFNAGAIPVCIKKSTSREIKEKNKIEQHKQTIATHLKLLKTNEKN